MEGAPTDRFREQMLRGAFFNAVGLAAKLVKPLLFVLLTWLFGPRLMAPYLLAIFLSELVSSTVVSGYAGATMILSSQSADQAADEPAARERLYRVLVNAFVVTFGVALLAAVAVQLVGAPLLGRFLPEYPQLLPGLYLLVWSLVPQAFSQIAIAACKAQFRMEYDAYLNGMLQPLLLLALCLGAYRLELGLVGLFGAHLVTEAVVAVAAGRALLRTFEGAQLRASLSAFRFDREMFAFAWPQSVNLTLNRYITRIDALMLAAMSVGAVEVAYYSTAVLLTSNLRQVRLVFSGALAPVAARYHSSGERGALERALGESSRWSASIIVPAVLLLALWRADILRLVDPAYETASLFVIVLLVPPLVGSVFGMAGNALVFTGHTGWTLVNSAVIAVTNTGLNALLIPRHGLLGAAVATSIAVTIITLLQMIELYGLERVRIRMSMLWKPLVGLLVGALALAAAWDPATLGVTTKLVASVGGLLGYLGLMRMLRHEEVTALLARLRSAAA